MILESEGKESVASVNILSTQISISLFVGWLLELDESISHASSEKFKGLKKMIIKLICKFVNTRNSRIIIWFNSWCRVPAAKQIFSLFSSFMQAFS